jgi:TPR repeat protein
MVDLVTPKDLNIAGDQYFYGQGVEKNIEVAFTYYKRAADLNNPVGLFNVGKYFLQKLDYKQAYNYYRQSSDLDYAPADIKISEMHLNGLGIKKSKKKAFKYLEKAVKLNEVDAYHQLGKFYLNGIGCSKNEIKAQELFSLSAQNNNSEGMYLLGSLLLNAKQIKNDYESAFFHLDKAAVNNNINAIDYLKTLYEKPHPYLKKHSDLYLKEMWFYYDEILANLGNVDALKRCAFEYYYGGETTSINLEKSFKFFKSLYSFDDTDGYFGLGISYLNGHGVNVDYTRAKDYLEIASNRGNAKAKAALGDMHRLGKGVDLNYGLARDYYLEAAKSDEVDALINLGLLHYRKQIKSASEALAFQFMNKASSFENANAYYWLGIFYDKGIGCNKDFDLAKKNFELAIVKGNVGAKYKLAGLIYEEINDKKISKRKKSKFYQEIKTLLIDYVNHPLNQEINMLYAMYLLGELYLERDFSENSLKVSRYWFENAAENNFTKAMVRMYEILKEKESKKALNWLKKACENPQDGEELFELSLVYEAGLYGESKNEIMAKKLLEKSANLNFVKAIQKLNIGN